jgi:tetratricopeptide (TPR) repeat protein
MKMDNRWIYRLCLLLLLTTAASCASNRVAAVRGTFSFLNTYESVRKDYEHGHIMEARAGALSIAKDKPGYAETQKLLKQKIEPARLRLLRHYAAEAKAAERKRVWFKARDLYNQAASFSVRGTYLKRKAAAMDLRVRQVRLDTIISRLRREDAELMRWLDSYSPPRQLDPQDEPFARGLETLQDWVDERARATYVAAKRNLRQGYPEVAYADIESYLRFEPDSFFGQRLMKSIKKELPKGLKIPPEPAGQVRRPSRHSVKSRMPASHLSGQEIRELIKQKKWLEAYSAALAYRREGGKDAERLFKEVDSHLEKQAEAAFKAGMIAFRSEDIDTAVKQWRRAVAFRPNNAQYIENLRRAEQLQERLRILRGRTEDDNK